MTKDAQPISYGLALLALASPVVFPALHGNAKTNFVLVQGGGSVVLLVIGVLTLAGTLLGRHLLLAVAGTVSGFAALLQLARLGHTTDWLHGDGSTAGLLLGLALGLIGVALSRPAPTPPAG